jgi:hypothetical protein
MARNYKNFLNSYLEYSSNQEATERVHLWTGIAVLAAALERRVWMPRGKYTLFPNLYVFICGPSGSIRKSTSTSIGVDLLRDLEKFNMMSERLTAASLIEQMSRHIKTYEHDGKTIKQSPTFIYASELKVFMEEVYGSINELLTTFYDCIPYDSEKPWVSMTRHQGENKIYGPCLNFLAASTLSWLREIIPTSQMEGGFSSRITFVIETGKPRKYIAWPEETDHMKGMRTRLVEDLHEIYSLSGPVTRTPEAHKLFEEWYIAHMDEVVTRNTDNRFSGYYGRKHDLVLKLSMISNVSRCGDLIVDVEDIAWAVHVVDDIEKQMMNTFKSLGTSNRLSGLMARIMEQINRNGGMTDTQIRRMFHIQAPMKDIDQCLADLARINEIFRLPNGLWIIPENQVNG